MDSPTAGEFFGRLAAAGQACLMLDYDGTLAPFTPDRDKARPYPGVVELLKRITEESRTRLAIISGRAVRQVLELLGWDSGIEFWGSHGAERLRADGSYEGYRLSAEQAQGISRATGALSDWCRPGRLSRSRSVLHCTGAEWTNQANQPGRRRFSPNGRKLPGSAPWRYIHSTGASN